MLYDIEVIAAAMLVVGGLLLVSRVWLWRNQRQKSERIQIDVANSTADEDR